MKLNYIMIPQRICDETKERTLTAVIGVALRASYFSQLEFSDVEIKARWGNGVYSIKPDGTIVLANHKFDTSG